MDDRRVLLELEEHGTHDMRLHFLIVAPEWAPPSPDTGDLVGYWLNGDAQLDHGEFMGVTIPASKIREYEGAKWVETMERQAWEKWSGLNKPSDPPASEEDRHD